MRAARERAAVVRRELRLLLSLRVLPIRVAWFFWRAWRHARRIGDRFSLVSPARPAELAELAALARGRSTVVELGTGTAWTAISLALAEPACRVISCDPCVRPEREAYLELAGAPVRERIELREEGDGAGPRTGDPLIDLLFIDSSHEREATVSAFLAWRAVLAPGAIVAFHDHGNPGYPGVGQAVEDLNLSGRKRHGLYLWQAP